MSLRNQHVFKFSGAQIAEAADARAGELLDELDETAVAQLRAELHLALGEQIDQMLTDRQWRYDGRGGDPSGPTISIPVAGDLWRRFELADYKHREKKEAISGYVAAAVRYRSQKTAMSVLGLVDGGLFELDESDVRHFGLDRS